MAPTLLIYDKFIPQGDEPPGAPGDIGEEASL